MTARLAMVDVSKRFGATQALRRVSLEVMPGEIHALIGENGAGKSTLMKVLSGACPPEDGDLFLDGDPYTAQNPRHARQCGIAMIYQELTLAPHLSVEENILLGEEPHRLGWINRRKRSELAREALAALDHTCLDLRCPVSSCSLAEKQVVEIARALVGRSRVIIMDEPTSSLTRRDTLLLFKVIRQLKARGVSVIYISHFLEECQELCDRFTVLRDGEAVAAGPIADTPLPSIVRAMIGRDVQDIYPKISHELGEEVLSVQDLRGIKKPRGVSLSLRRGEIFGLAGLIGAGRTETLRACFGLDPMTGRLSIQNKTVGSPTPAASWRSGVGFLSENRKEEGLMLTRSVSENLTITHLQPFQRAGFVSRQAQQAATESWINRMNIRAQSADQPIGQLSGGNQQKVALARLLHHDVSILFLDEPTRGIDVGSKMEIYHLLGELARQGKSIVFVSSYLPELLGMCDTIGVMSRGRLVEVRPRSEWTEEEIMSRAISPTES